jgi:hypothetical protein
MFDSSRYRYKATSMLAPVAAAAEESLVAPSSTDAAVLTVAAAELRVAPSNQEAPAVVELHRADRSMPAPVTPGMREPELARGSRRQPQLVVAPGELEPSSSTGRRILPCRRMATTMHGRQI